MKIVKTYGVFVTTLIIIVVAIVLRLYFYGDPRLSVAMNDTQSYIDLSRAPVFSWASITGRRLFTMNLVYNIFVNNTRCHLSSISHPAAVQEANLKLQYCFDRIAFLQNLLSILGWSFLALELSSHIKTPLYKILITIIVLSFALSPQIAEWDSVLSSESLTLSLFAICFALMIEIAFQLFGDRNRNQSTIYFLLAGWLIVFGLWVFVQDANLYFVPITLLLLLPVIIKGRAKQKALLITFFYLVGVFAIGLIASAQSTRWQPSIEHSYERYIFPNSSGINFIKEFGAPDLNAPSFPQWFNKRAPSVYLLFLASHPGFVVSNVLEYMPMFTADFLQPYFIAQNTSLSSALLSLGEVFHPETGGVYLVDTLLLAFMCYTAVDKKERMTRIWTWIGIWIFVSSVAMLFIRYFGDTAGVLRHIFPAVEFLRLLLWILLIVQADLLAIRGNEITSLKKKLE